MNVGSPPRFTMRQFWQDAADELLSFDRGMLWTLWRLWSAPGALITSYLDTRDPRITRPLRLALIQVALAVLMLGLCGVDAMAEFRGGFLRGLRHDAGSNPPSTPALDWLLANADLLLLCAIIPAIAIATGRLFAAAGRNTAEHWVAAVFVYAQLAVPGALLLIGGERWKSAGFGSALILLLVLLVARASAATFGARMRMPWLRGGAAGVLTMLLLVAVMVATLAVVTMLDGI